MGSVQYIKNLVGDKNVASVAPTSMFGVNKICRCIDFSTVEVIVEYGPGSGVITEVLLKRMPPQAKLIAIETNERFADAVEKKIDDERFTLVRGSAENISQILEGLGIKKADYIISGIPFSLFDVPKKDRIIIGTRESLALTGSFLVYQFLISAGKRKFDIKKKLTQHMKIIRSDYELLAIPPIRIYQAVRSEWRKKTVDDMGDAFGSSEQDSDETVSSEQDSASPVM